jgi:GTP-binding protein
MSAVSAIHGRGTGDLMDLIATHTKTSRVAPTSPNLRLTILGRPNVGKSSLFNALAGQRQAIVSAQAGTTRDTGRIELKYHGQTVELTDTAGLRKRGRIVPGIEKFSTLRTASAASGADICLVVMDALEPGVAGDQHIAGLVASGGQGLILVVNKWDAVDKDDKTQARTLRRLQHDFQFVWWAPLVFTSATEGHNVPKILELATEIKARREVKIPTPKLNRTLQQLVTAQPPAGLKNRHPKLNYVTQTGVNPPTFTIFGAQTDGLHFSYRRYLENGLRSTYDLTGTPIKFEFRDKRNLSLRGAK